MTSTAVLYCEKRNMCYCWFFWFFFASMRGVINYHGRWFIILTNHDWLYHICRVFIKQILLVITLVWLVESMLDSGFISCNTPLECSILVEDVAVFFLLVIFFYPCHLLSCLYLVAWLSGLEHIELLVPFES